MFAENGYFYDNILNKNLWYTRIRPQHFILETHLLSQS